MPGDDVTRHVTRCVCERGIGGNGPADVRQSPDRESSHPESFRPDEIGIVVSRADRLGHHAAGRESVGQSQDFRVVQAREIGRPPIRPLIKRDGRVGRRRRCAVGCGERVSAIRGERICIRIGPVREVNRTDALVQTLIRDRSAGERPVQLHRRNRRALLHAVLVVHESRDGW